MRIIFDKIKIENFLSIGSAELDLGNRGYCLINGINKNPSDLAKSNGSGKSSIMEAICYALTGETIRGVKDVVNMYRDGGTYVELTFYVDNDEYIIQRYKEHKKFKTDLKIFINGQDKSGKGIRDSQKLLESYLPDLTSSLIGSVILLGQGLPQRFTNNSPSGRKEVLEKLSKSDFMIDDLKKRLQERKSYLSSELRKAEDNLLAANSKKITLERQIEEAQNRLTTMEDPSIYEDLISRSIEKLNYIDKTIEDLREKLKEYRTQLDKVQDEKSTILSNITKDENEANIEYLNIKHQVNQELNNILSDIKNIEAELRKAKSIKDICPTCGQKLPGVFKPDTSEFEYRLDELYKQKALVDEKIREVESRNREVQIKFSELKTTATKDVNNKIIEAQAHIQSLERSLGSQQSERTSEQNNLGRYQSLKATYQATVDSINNIIIENTNQIEELDKNSVYYYDSKLNYSQRLEVINKFVTITNRDFRGYLLKNVIEFIDRKAKEYCQDIFETNLIEFMLDGNNIDIRYSGKQYEVLSGGEQQKVNLIVQFAIRDMLCQFLDFRCNILALDEIFDNLDSTGCDKVIDLISKKLNDVDSVFIISHHTDLAIPSDSIITVTKHADGVSSIS